MDKYDAIIIGAGPAGMFAAYELCKNRNDLKILIIDKGKTVEKRICQMKETEKCINCETCDIMCGVGGAGTFSDGLLNLRPDIGGNLEEFTKNKSDARELVNYVDEVYVKFGAPKEKLGTCQEKIDELKKKSASVGVHFVDIQQRHMGSDGATRVIKNFVDYLKSRNVEILTEEEVEDLIVENNICKGIVLKNHPNRKIFSDQTILCPGRIGVGLTSKVINKHKISARYKAIDIGVRVEIPAIIMDDIISINRDPKFQLWTQQYGDFVRTFCTNHHGFVVKERYKNFVCVNGHSLLNEKSENTNFAFLVKINLTEPLENTTLYGELCAHTATLLGGGKPLIQRLGDLRRGRRSTPERLKRSFVEPTLKDVTPSNLAMVFSHRILADILEGLEKLNAVIPGVASDSTLIYAPEIKFYAMRVEVDKAMQTSVKNLFAAGDGAGLSRDIINASATGVLAGRGILNFLK
ncbi:MAG: FAD-dependent oxidoreductase [Candidatus Altarchaeum sp. CG12_big_fil_rev_8_21_14_0_65_33_22]|nr:MAG: FAD-dependent oxidoreductase [Candidatus Altarchaeum sp. CG12_big_fil_rev_8_21_14_0_65_33_22]